MSQTPKTKIEKALDAIKKEFVVVKKDKIRPWEAWLVLGVIAGVAIGVLYVANPQGKFEVSKAAVQCEMYSEEVPIDCDEDIFGYRHCSPIGPVSGCNNDPDDFEPIYCWINHQVCYDVPDPLPPPDTTSTTDFPDPMSDISMQAVEEIINMADIWEDFDQTFDDDFLIGLADASQDFFPDVSEIPEDALSDFIDNFDDPKAEESEGEVIELTNEGQSSQLEEAAIEGALQLSEDTESIVDDARGYTDEELAEEEEGQENDDVIMGATQADVDTALKNQPSACSYATHSPNIKIGNCGLSELEINDWVNIIRIGGNNAPQEIRSLIYNGTIPFFIFNNRNEFNQFASDVVYSIGGQRIPPVNFSGFTGLTLGHINSRERTAILIYEPAATQYDIFTENTVHQNWNKRLYVLQHELMHATVQYKFASPDGGFDGVSISARNSNPANFKTLTQFNWNGRMISQTVACVTQYACTDDPEYWADTGPQYIRLATAPLSLRIQILYPDFYLAVRL